MDDLNNLLRAIGMRIFVQYFHGFRECSDQETNLAMIALLRENEKFTLNSCRGRTSKARRIFREGLEEQTLSIIADSSRVEQEVADGASALLAELRRRQGSSGRQRTQQSMKIIKIVKLAIQKAAKERKKMSTFHSQVLLHAELFEHLDPTEFCRDVGVPAAYHIEFRKMIAVAHTLSELGYSIQKR